MLTSVYFLESWRETHPQVADKQRCQVCPATTSPPVKRTFDTTNYSEKTSDIVTLINDMSALDKRGVYLNIFRTDDHLR